MYGCANRDKDMIKLGHWSILVDYSESEPESSPNSTSINLGIFFFFTLYLHSSK